MEKKIYIAPLQKSFTIDLKDANRQKRNKSYSNASPCCNVALKQEKKCGVCATVIQTSEVTQKIVKIGKEEYLIDADALKSVQDELASIENEITVTSFIKQKPSELEDKYDGLVFALPAKKNEEQYAELAKILKGRCAIGTAIIRSNEYQVVLEVGNDDVIRMRKLVEPSQMYDINKELATKVVNSTPVNEQIIELENKIIDKNTIDDYDFEQFQDRRSEYEERIIEEYVLHGRKPETTPSIRQEQQVDELERLKQLAGV